MSQSYEIGVTQAQLKEWGYDHQTWSPNAMGWISVPVSIDSVPGQATDGWVPHVAARQVRNQEPYN